MITKETVKNIFGAAGSPMPALDHVVDYLNKNLRYYPTAEFLKTSLDENTLFQMSVSFSSPFPIRRLARRSVFVPNVAEQRLVYLGTSPHDSTGDIYIGVQGKTTAYKYDFGGYHTYLTEDGKLIVTKETILQDANDPENRLAIRAIVPEEGKRISLSALDAVVPEEFRGLYAK